MSVMTQNTMVPFDDQKAEAVAAKQYWEQVVERLRSNSLLVLSAEENLNFWLDRLRELEQRELDMQRAWDDETWFWMDYQD